jgi:ABC-type polysaccharide/polyol phosphate transport system ATPase subunit
MAPVVRFESVSKKFRRGERHDSIRDLVPALVKGWMGRQPADELQDQEFWALKDVSFEVGKGEALGIIGPNGAGKSTALKLLTRILKPTKGQCEVKGRVGALIEVAAGFHGDLTGRENVYLQGAIMGMSHQQIEKQFANIVEFSGIAPFIDTPVKRYSSGMQARLGFSVAAHLEPDVLFVDEVLSVGDMSFQARCMDKMAEQLRNGVTVVFVSHNLQAVAALCDRTVVLGGGSKLFDGAPEQAIETYLKAVPALPSARYGALSSFEVASVVFTANGTVQKPGSAVLGRHARCEIVMTLRCLEDTPACCIGLSIDRTADGFYCYGVGSEELDEPLFQCHAGDVVRVAVNFTAHFSRGHYTVNLNVRDPRAGVFHMFAESAATFSIDENVSYGGIVDVAPEIRVHRRVDAQREEVLLAR